MLMGAGAAIPPPRSKADAEQELVPAFPSRSRHAGLRCRNEGFALILRAEPILCARSRKVCRAFVKAAAAPRRVAGTWTRMRTFTLQIGTNAQQMLNDRSATLWTAHGTPRTPHPPLLVTALCVSRSRRRGRMQRAVSGLRRRRPWELSASFGAGQRSNPVAGRSDIPLVVIPHISYYGKRFFLENLELGYTLHDGDTHTFNLIAAPGYDRVFFYRNDLQNIFVPGGTALHHADGDTVAEHRPLPCAASLVTPLIWSDRNGRSADGAVTGQLNALREVTGEARWLRSARRPRCSAAHTKHSLVASTGLTWKSAEVVRYYYGVDELYEPGSALSPFVKLRYSFPLSDRWTAERVRSLRASAGLHCEQSCHLREPCYDCVCRRRVQGSLASTGSAAPLVACALLSVIAGAHRRGGADGSMSASRCN